MDTIPASLVDNAINESANDTVTVSNRYSGRGMYGKECFSISGSSYDVEEVIHTLRKWTEDDDDLPTLGRPSFDAMGLGVVAYWPGVSLSGTSRHDDMAEVNVEVTIKVVVTIPQRDYDEDSLGAVEDALDNYLADNKSLPEPIDYHLV